MPKRKNPKVVSKKQTTKKVRFNDQARARADTQMASRGLNTLIIGEKGVNKNQRYGANPKRVYLGLNLVERFKSKFNFARKDYDKNRSLLSATKAFFRKPSADGVYTSNFKTKKTSNADQGRINLTRYKTTLRRKNGYSKRKKYYQPLIFHEFAHSMHLPNGYIMPSAFESYLDSRVFFKDQKILSGEELVKRAVNLEILKTKINKRNKKNKVGEYESQPEFNSPWQVGKELGELAYNIEAKLKKKGIGLFFIREFGFDKDIVTTIHKISKGQFDAELKDWLKMNPRLARILN